MKFLRGQATPLISVIVVFFNMRREAARTLHTLSRAYQRGIEDLEYEVIAVENGSTEPLDEAFVESFGPEFHYLRQERQTVSPCAAINLGAAQARGSLIAVCIDGARMVSPGMLRYTELASRLADAPVITTLAWHLGSETQNVAMKHGYDQVAEDELLESVDWKREGYDLFEIAVPAASSREGWFAPLPESNFLTVPRSTFDAVGGFDEQFDSRGGGLANHDYLRRCLDQSSATHVMLLGEGSFHQFHGGVATNVPLELHPGKLYAAEYERIRGAAFKPSEKRPIYVGSISKHLLGLTSQFAGMAAEPSP